MDRSISNARHGSEYVARLFVNNFVSRFGALNYLHTDQGRNFESILVKETCHLLGITKTRTTPYQPQSNGMFKRFNRTLLSMLNTAVAKQEDSWDLHLPLLMLAYRTIVYMLLLKPAIQPDVWARSTTARRCPVWNTDRSAYKLYDSLCARPEGWFGIRIPSCKGNHRSKPALTKGAA